MALALQQLSSRKLQPQMSRLESLGSTLTMSVSRYMENRRGRLDSIAQLLDALSPQATLKRGYSITRFNGVAVRSQGDVPEGPVLETTLADGVIYSVTK